MSQKGLVRAIKQLTVRGFDRELERCLHEVARTQGVSLNQAALILLRKGAGLGEAQPRSNAVGASLDHLIGSWSREEEEEFLKAVGELGEIDPSLWR